MSAYQDNSVATFVQKTFEILRVSLLIARTHNFMILSTGCIMDLNSSSNLLNSSKKLFYLSISDIEMLIASSDRYTI